MGERPSVRFVRWFWRVSQAAPGAGIAGRVVSAAFLATEERSGGWGHAGTAKTIRGAEWGLAYRPWEDENRRNSYVEAVTRAENPIEGLGRVALPESESENAAELLAEMERLSGGSDTFTWYLIQRMLVGRW